MAEHLTDDVVETIKSAAKKLTGFRRREFMAEVAVKYCDGSSRKTETLFGFRRDAVHTGLQELRTGIRCLDNVTARGRKKSEAKCPQMEAKIRRLVEPQAQADPKFQTVLAFTRITARVVREELLVDRDCQDAVPCRQTVGEILNRMGYRLRRVLKTRPEKKSRKPTPSLSTCRPPGRLPRRTRTV